MRALNPTASKTLAKFNSSKPSHRKPPCPPDTTTTSEGASAHGPTYPLNSSTTSSRPRRPTSRQSTLSSSFSTASATAKTTIRRLPSADSLAAKTSRPTIITKTVAKTPRAAPNPAANYSTNNNNNNNPPAVQPKQSSTPSSLPAARSPLTPRDENATQMTGKAPSMSRNVKVTMPHDRSPNPNGGRPQLPTLSASAARGVNKPAVLPKIATKSPQPPTLAPNSHTPLPKRVARPANGNLATPAPSRSTPQPEDEPMPFLSNNVTPRSGKRQSRVDSANSTPNGTPNPDRHDGWDRDSRVSRAASPAGYEGDAARRLPAAFNSMSDLHMAPKQDLHASLDSKFFHASDVKSNHPVAPQKPTLAKAPTFFYANGNKIDSKPSTPGSFTSVPSHKSSQDNLSSKFVYANGTPDLKPSPSAGSSRPGSVVSMASKAPTSRPGTSNHGSVLAGSQRPASPVKLAQQPHVGLARNTNLPTLTANRALPPQLGPPVGLRRTSTGTTRTSHSRNGSLTGSMIMGDVDVKSTFIPSAPPSPLPLASPSQPPLSLASIIQAAEEFGEDESFVSQDDSHSEIQSPTKSTHSGDPLSELVANARRERKVQDLQITNASLEAINRTLERQLRKQTAELRRFRRLTRTGRLSMASSGASSRIVSDPLSLDDGIEGLVLSDLDEEESEEELEEEDSFSETDSVSESLSANLFAERDARHRKRDEDRLQLDLSKHQELLHDSQKMNQSIKRCLDWTEELIKEGKKALEYTVRVSDVHVPGPRVLNPVDEEEENTQTSFNFDPDTTFDYEDASILSDEDQDKPERVVPLEPRLAGWQPEDDG